GELVGAAAGESAAPWFGALPRGPARRSVYAGAALSAAQLGGRTMACAIAAAAMKIRPLASHARDQGRPAARTASRVEQVRIEAIAFAVALRRGAIEGFGGGMARISMSHDGAP